MTEASIDTKEAHRMYTRKARVYDFVFVRLLGWGRALKKFFRHEHYLQPGYKVLDAGCGAGVVTKALYAVAQEKGISSLLFHGFDLTRAMLALFERWIQKNKAMPVEIRQANVLALQDLPKDWNNYDLVISSGLLEYIPKNKITQALGNLRNRLKTGGAALLFISRPSWSNKIIQYFWHQQLFTEAEIRAAAEHAGFTAVAFKQPPSVSGYAMRWCFIVELGN